MTHGDRRATESRDLSKYNFENKVGRGWAVAGRPPSIPASLTPPAPQYGARALSRVLATILGQTDNRVPLPQGYPGGDAAFFRGEPGLLSQGGVGSTVEAGSIRIWGMGMWVGFWERAPWDPRISIRSSLADMKQGLLSVGIGVRESRTGCLDVEKGESHIYEEGSDWEGEDTGLRPNSAPQTAPSPSS